MSEVAPTTVNQCGTQAPAYMSATSGGHPTLAQGIVSRTACYYWNGDTCLWTSTVKVAQCTGGYYVYQFGQSIGCNLRICSSSVVPASLGH